MRNATPFLLFSKLLTPNSELHTNLAALQRDLKSQTLVLVTSQFWRDALPRVRSIVTCGHDKAWPSRISPFGRDDMQ